MFYDRASATFRNEIGQNTPSRMPNASTTRERRSFGEINTDHHGGRGKGCSDWVHKTRTDSSIITLTDGHNIEYHPSFNFPRHIFQKMKRSDKNMLTRERIECRNNHRSGEFSTIGPSHPITHENVDNHTQVSQLSQRNDNASITSNNSANSRIMMD